MIVKFLITVEITITVLYKQVVCFCVVCLKCFATFLILVSRVNRPRFTMDKTLHGDIGFTDNFDQMNLSKSPHFVLLKIISFFKKVPTSHSWKIIKSLHQSFFALSLILYNYVIWRTRRWICDGNGYNDNNRRKLKTNGLTNDE